MIFGKKRRMIDVRELQRRGVVRIPKNDVVVPTNRDGFIEMGTNGSQKPETQSPPTSAAPSTSSNTEFFGFMDSTTSTTPSSPEFSTESDGYNKREVDAKVTELDNKIYKLENRIELLEKKLDVNQPADSNVGVMGW